MEMETTTAGYGKRSLRCILYVAVAGIVLLLLAITVLFIYSDEVKASILKELNKHLKAEVQVAPENISVTILRSFPDCSLQFRDVLMLEVTGKKRRDTLLYARTVNLHFSFLDLWNKKYRIRKLTLTDGAVHLKTLPDGSHNFIFWEQKESSGDHAADFDLEKIIIRNTSVSYIHTKNNFRLRSNLKTIEFAGKFKSDKYNLKTSADLWINELANDKVTLLREKRLAAELELRVNKTEYSIQSARMRVNDLALDLSGTFTYENELSGVRLKFNAPELNIQSVFSLMPESERDRMKDYRSLGDLYVNGALSYNSSSQFTLQSRFGIENGSVTYQPSDITAEKVNVKGELYYSEGRSELLLEEIAVTLNEDIMTGDCRISDFEDPYIEFSTKAAFRPENLLGFWPVDTISEARGKVRLEGRLKGKIEEVKTQILSERIELGLDAAVQDLEVKFRNDDKTYTVEKCILSAADRKIKVNDLALKRGSSDLLINGEVPGMLNYLLDRTQPLTIRGSLRSEKLLLEDFLQKESAGKGFSGPLIPAGVHLTLDASVTAFSFGKFDARSITGDIEIKNQKTIINEVVLQTMGGAASLNAFADNSGGDLEVVLEGDLRNIDIRELFRQMNNFGQKTLTENNIRGTLSASVNFKGRWSSQLVADEKSIVAGAQLSIERGQLVNFTPLNQLSKFVDVEDLRDIKFSNLQSNISIEDRVIYIPRTSLKNSALNIEVSGTHSFDNNIDYHISLLISELLSAKRKKEKSEFGEVANDPENRRRAFIRMSGSAEDPRFRYDKQGMKEKVQEDIRRERQNLKQVLKEELGLFRKDTALRRPKTEQPVFRIEEEKPAPRKNLELRKKEEEDF